MKKTDLNDIFKNIYIMTKTGGLPKKTFLHPESDKDYYKRSSTGDILGKGKSRKNLSFVVLVEKIDKRLKDVIWTKLQSILPDLNSFDCKEITDKLEKKFLDSRLPDEKTLNEELRQKIDIKLQKCDSDKLWIVNRFVNVVEKGHLTTEEFMEIIKTIENQNPAKTLAVPLESSSQQENKQRIKTKEELKDTSKSRATEESTSDLDGALEQQLRSTKGNKETQKPKVSKSKSIKEFSMNDKETLQQESRTTDRKKQTLKPTASKSTSQQKSTEGKKQTQNAKRKLKDDDSTKDRSSIKKPRLMQEQQMNENSLQLEAGKRTK
jgi:hypothetical protein